MTELIFEKEAALPLGLILGGGLSALGAYGGLQDIKQGVREGSVGKTLWGAAQIPLSFAGGTGMGLRLARDLPRMARAGGLVSKIPGMSRLAGGMPRTRRFFGMLEGAGKRMGGAMLAPAGYLGGPRAQSWIRRSPMFKRMVGGTALFMGVPALLGYGASRAGGAGGAGGGPGGSAGMPGPGGQMYGPDGQPINRYSNVAPGVKFLGMPTPGAQGQEFTMPAQEPQNG